MKEQDEHTFRELQRSFLQYKLAADTLRVQGNYDAAVGIILPKTQGLTFRVVTDTGGKLSIVTDDDFGNTTTIRIGRMSAEAAGFSGERSVAAYESGGIHVKTAGRNPAWTTPALLQISPVEPTAARMEIGIISFAENAVISGSGHLPVTMMLQEYAARTLYWKDNTTIQFQSPDAEQRKLWETVFFETKERIATGSNYRIDHPDSSTLLVQTANRIPLFTIRQTDPLTLRLETSMNTTLSEIILREAVYATGPAEIIHA
ncbi:MAG: hypothetical protein LBL85_04050 [Methanocalculaceae archaeon]|jgi:hypothetical protein|nr:hypothetical protein [Methanocalculaceae archaeon]